MAFTTVAVPSGAVAGASMIYDVTADEREAMRNFVAKWSKNSTLIPIRDKKTGKLSYVDFSHTNAYDTLTRPIQTIINNVQAGRKDQDGMMDDFFLGVIYATKELASVEYKKWELNSTGAWSYDLQRFYKYGIKKMR